MNRKAGRGNRPDDPPMVGGGRRGADTAANGYRTGTSTKSKQFAGRAPSNQRIAVASQRGGEGLL
jgi:hypothetical protein